MPHIPYHIQIGSNIKEKGEEERDERHPYLYFLPNYLTFKVSR